MTAEDLLQYRSSDAGPRPAAEGPAPEVKFSVENFGVEYNGRPALRNVDLRINARERLAIIGPAGSGKSTILRCLNRLNDLEPNFRHTGRILLDGKDIYDRRTDVADLRRRVGMVYAVPTPLP